MQRPKQHASQSLRRFPAIDLLRGVSVLLVVLHHVHIRFVLSHFPVKELLPQPLARVFFWSGYYAVVMFFVISGFLITHHSLRRWRTLPRIALGGFYWLRFTRIYPCLLLLLAVLSCLHLAGLKDYVIDPQLSSLGRAWLAALSFHFNWLEGTRGYLPGSWDVLWSLSVEEAFYFVFPLACVCLRREGLMIGLLVLALAIGPISRALIGDDPPWDEYAYASCVDCLSFGCLAAWLQQRLQYPPKWLVVTALATGLVLVLFVDVTRNAVVALGLVDTGLYISVLACGTALMLWAIAESEDELRWLRCAWLQSIGQHSYEIYLTHMFVVFATVRVFAGSAVSIAWVPLFYVGALLCAVILGWLVARAYSEPLAAALRRRAPVARPVPQPPTAE